VTEGVTVRNDMGSEEAPAPVALERDADSRSV
jgi:hypothetical protein